MKNTYYFLALTFTYLLFGELNQVVLNVEELQIVSLAEQLSYDQITNYLNIQKKWVWLSYLVLPLLLLLKVSLIAAAIDIGCFFYDKEIRYSRLFTIVIKSEFIFLLVIVVKTAWFYFYQTNYTFEDLQYFYPFSVLNFMDYKELQPWFIYPLQVINIFEVIYWLLLAFFIGKEIRENIYKGLPIVASSYGLSLVIWVVGVMFFTLNMSS